MNQKGRTSGNLRNMQSNIPTSSRLKRGRLGIVLESQHWGISTAASTEPNSRDGIRWLGVKGEVCVGGGGGCRLEEWTILKSIHEGGHQITEIESEVGFCTKSGVILNDLGHGES